MENKKSPSQKKLLHNQEKSFHQVKCESGATRSYKNQHCLEPGIIRNKTTQQPLQGIQVTVTPQSPPIKTLFLAEKSRFKSRKGSEKSRSALAIGDHQSFNTHFAETRCSSARPSAGDKQRPEGQTSSDEKLGKGFNQSRVNRLPGKPKNKAKLCPAERCHVHTHPSIPLTNHLNLKENLTREPNFDKNIRKFIDAHDTSNKNLPSSIIRLNNRIETIKHLVRKQEMVLGGFDSPHCLSSSDDESRDGMARDSSGSARPGCSYIEHYSHIPETSAFQRYAQQSSSQTPNKGAPLEKEHNSEQYGRDFTAYDGLTARARRQCSSATTKRDEVPQAAERMIKIRHKLNPVRDYRLMDTVHYLAQGEFAPRNDGIKLTPSREAVLSDIIWEDVCRTHWPTARLGRRQAQERYNTRSELQRLIDSLLRERVAHVERRRRRHYRIIKHTQHSAGRVGKTGDIIVASHKHKHRDESDIPTGRTHHASGLMLSNTRWPENRSHRSDDRMTSPERRRALQEDCTPGPSYAAPRSRREPTYCYHAAGPSRQTERSINTCEYTKERYSSSSTASSEKQRKNPRLVVKKDPSRKKNHEKELNLEHFILLPTLVVRTPSNVKRQKKFNELYHRILNQLSTEQTSATRNLQTDPRSHRNCKNDSETSVDHGKK